MRGLARGLGCSESLQDVASGKTWVARVRYSDPVGLGLVRGRSHGVGVPNPCDPPGTAVGFVWSRGTELARFWPGFVPPARIVTPERPLASFGPATSSTTRPGVGFVPPAPFKRFASGPPRTWPIQPGPDHASSDRTSEQSGKPRLGVVPHPSTQSSDALPGEACGHVGSNVFHGLFSTSRRGRCGDRPLLFIALVDSPRSA